MAYFYKLEMYEKATPDYRQVTQIRGFVDSNIVTGMTGHFSGGNYVGVMSSLFDGLTTDTLMGFNKTGLAYVIFESPVKLEALKIYSMDAYPATDIAIFEYEGANWPWYNDAVWNQVYSNDNYTTDSTDADLIELIPQYMNKKYLLRNAAGTTFKYETGNFIQVSSSDPTEAEFTTHGMNGLFDIPVSELMTWEPTGNFTLEYFDETATAASAKNLQITSVPKAQIALPDSVVNLDGVTELNNINIIQTLAATGASRFAISIDRTNWKVWNGSNWVDLSALSADQTSADYLMANGMEASAVTALTWTELQQLYTGAPTAIAVAYAVEAKAIDDTAAIDKVELTMMHSGQKWIRDHGQIELEITGSGFVATPSIDCTFKVNYQDTAA